MRIVHVPFTFAPDPVGGTEVYVANLVGALRARGVEGLVAAPGARNECYEAQHIAVHRFAMSSQVRLEDLYGQGDLAAAAAFGAVLDDVRPDLVHLHAYTSAVSLRTLREAKRRRLPVVFTFHTPTVTCQRGTLLEYGASICDGVMRPRRCTACALHARGLPRLLAACAAATPRAAQRMIGRWAPAGGVWTGLQFGALVDLRQSAVHAFLDGCDRIVVPARWVGEVLERNDIPPQKLSFCRQGVTAAARAARPARSPGEPLRIAWLGRLHPTKGLHLLADALAMIPSLDLVLDAYGIAESPTDAYVEHLHARAARDPRLRLRDPVPAATVVEKLAGYDVVAVPSQLLETGPLVLLEAFAAGVPVVGSALGGIAEIVEHERTGLLVEAGDARAWAGALKLLHENRGELDRLHANIGVQRSMAQVAGEMRDLYATMLA